MSGGEGSADLPEPPARPPLAADPPRRPEPPEPAAPQPTIAERVRAAPITFTILALDLAVFLWAEKHGSTEQIGVLLRFGAVEPVHVWLGEYWRLATYMFLHIGWIHFLWNSYASVGWSTSVERALGGRRFLLVYLLAGVGGGAASAIFSAAVSAGASGAMFGIVGATLALRRRQLPSFAAFFADKGARSTFFSIGLWTVIGFTALRMNHFAHFGGFAVGALATWLATSPAAGRGAPWAAFGAGFVALVVAAIHPWKPSARLAASASVWARGYLRGEPSIGLEQDTARGTHFAEEACNRGVPNACYLFGAALSQSEDAGRDKRAFELFRGACEGGDQDGCGAEGWALVFGRGAPKDEARGRRMLVDACERNSVDACTTLSKEHDRALVAPDAK